MKDILTLKSVSYKIKDKMILKDISISLFPNSCLSIVGESGSGKSSLAKVIYGNIKNITGSIIYNIPSHTPKSRSMQMVFQNISNSLNPTMTIKESILEPLKLTPDIPKDQYESLITQAINTVSFPEYLLKSKPYQLSGGQQQRASIARAIITKPMLLICDEPLSSLDMPRQNAILEVFKKIKNEENTTILFITHDIASAYFLADYIAVMDQGSIIEYNHAHQLLSNPQHIKTQKLIDAIPSFCIEDTDINYMNYQTTVVN